MSESKLKKLIVATTVGAVLLIVVLLSIMVYQLISIKVQRNRIENLEAKIALYEQMCEDGENTLEQRSLNEWIIREAKKLGYNFKKN